MNIDKISLYLSGKFPPYYWGSFDKLEFIELLRSKSPSGFSDDFFRLIDSQDFYSMCLNRVKRTDKPALFEILKTLKIPEDAGGLGKSELINEKLKELKQQYEIMKWVSKKDANKRWYSFENWIYELFNLFELKPRKSYRSEFDQIDWSFELDWRIYLLELKWLGEPIDKTVVDSFSWKISRCLVWTIWLIISQSSFNITAKKIAGIMTIKNIVMLDWNDIEEVLSWNIKLPDLIKSVIRRMSEEWVPHIKPKGIKKIR